MPKKKKIQNVATNPDGSFGFVDEMADEDFFDDCLVCQAMKKAKQEGRELSEKELRQALELSKDQGNIVGGDWFDRPQSPIRI